MTGISTTIADTAEQGYVDGEWLVWPGLARNTGTDPTIYELISDSIIRRTCQYVVTLC